MKNKIITVALLTAMAVSLTSCGNGNSGSSGATRGAAEDDNTLNVWCWDPNFNIYAMKKAAEIYAEDHEGFKVNVTEVQSEDIETKLTTYMSSNELDLLPDIFLMQDNSFQKYASNYPDIFTDLTDSGIDFSQFAEAKTAYSTIDGRHLGVPFDNATVINAMRTDLLEQAGYTLDDFTDITWSDYLEKAKDVKEKTGLPMLTLQAGSPDIIMMMLQSCGQSLFKKDGSVNIKGNKVLKQSMEIYAQMVKDGTLREVTDNDQYIGSLNNGSVVSTINGCWIMASIIDQEDQAGSWELTTMPRLDAEDASNHSNNGGSSWAVTSNCKNKKLAYDFFNETFAGSTDLYDDIIQKGAVATWAPAGETDAYAEESDFFSGQKVNSMLIDYGTQTPSNYTGPFYYDARDAIGVALSNVTQQGSDLDSEIDTAQETAEFNMEG